MAEEYGAKNIRVLKGVESVRQVPAMYIGDTGIRGIHHLFYEVLDNSIDAVTYTIKSNGVKASLTDADLLVLSIFGNDDKISKDEIYRRVNNVSLRNRINQLDRLRHIYVRK